MHIFETQSHVAQAASNWMYCYDDLGLEPPASTSQVTDMRGVHRHAPLSVVLGIEPRAVCMSVHYQLSNMYPQPHVLKKVHFHFHCNLHCVS